MTIVTRFGKKLKVPSTVQIKHQFLLWWLARQTEKESLEVSEQTAAHSIPIHIHDATF